MDKFKEYLPDFGLLWLRVLMGVGIAYHGYGKVVWRENRPFC